MRAGRRWGWLALAASCWLALGSRCAYHEPPGHALFLGPQSNPVALSQRGALLYVANTTGNSVSVVSTRLLRVIDEIPVGLEPVGVALRPDGKQLWVANHVSDSVSVIDTDWRSPTYHQVVATVQDLDARGATRFDEPVGIAFAHAAKAYVALSSRNEIAVVDVDDAGPRIRPERLRIPAQEPRAIAVRGGRLYVAAFESSNQTEISICPLVESPPQCSFGEDFVDTSGLRHIVVDPDVPDRDLFVFDTRDESLVDVVSHVGTLLYGLAVGGDGRVYVAETDARNAVNGLEGASLSDLENRMYLNRIAVVDCSGEACAFEPGRDVVGLEPLPPLQPQEGRQLATPYAIAVSDDDATVLATAAASSRLFSLDAQTGAVLDVLDVGAIPRGLALGSHPRTGAPQTAYVLNTLESSVSVVRVARSGELFETARIPIGHDPTPEPVRQGRIAFNDAGLSSTGTFSCASCHPDGHIDQLIWRIGGGCAPDLDPECDGLDQARTTQDIRGLRNTLPLHWDGSLGNPFGGPKGESEDGSADCALGDADGDHDCFVDLVQASLSGVMCDQAGPCPAGAGVPELVQQQMARFLASVWHPPARSRSIDDVVSPAALDGFSDFTVSHFFGNGTCATGGCHSLPLGSDTQPEALKRDSPSLRGLTDRYVHLSFGPNSAEEVLAFANAPAGLPPPFDRAPPSPFPWDPAVGYDERTTFSVGFLVFRFTHNVGPADIFQMLEEASTGTSGATGRQVTLASRTLSDGPSDATLALLARLEAADARGAVRLMGHAQRPGSVRRQRTAVSFQPQLDQYLLGEEPIARDRLLEAARSGRLSVTLTAHLSPRFGEGVHRQPLLAPAVEGAGPTGDPALPVLPSENPMLLRGIDIRPGASLLVDGEPASGTLSCVDGDFASGFCSSQRVEIGLDAPLGSGLHLLQVKNPDGPFSNELPICVEPLLDCR